MEATSTVTSTYRIQFSPYFTFGDALELTGYLRELGISHVYASPIMEAVPGSVHGYDVTDFSNVRKELGGEAGFDKLNASLRRKGIGWIQDFVPNHMAMDVSNPYIRDTLEKGKNSPYAGLFDIDWEHPAFEGGKLCLPFLERPYFDELNSGKFSFCLGRGILLMYRGMEIPVSSSSYELLLGKDLSMKALQIFHDIGNEDTRGEVGDFGKEIDEIVEEISRMLDISSRNNDLVDKVISVQNYSLRYWRSTAHEINYRRFFAVNGLICLSEEHEEVFSKVHDKLLSLIRSGKVDGIRIDHVDGMRDPETYLGRLREAAGDVYIVVEKILEQDESLDENWPVEGTSGYDFLGRVASLMCTVENSRELDSVYRRFTGVDGEESKIVYAFKLDTIDSLYPAVLDTITCAFMKGLRSMPYGRDLTFHGLRDAIKEILARTPVYRTYVGRSDAADNSLALLKSIIRISRGSREDLSSYFDAIEMYTDRYKVDPDACMAIQIMQQYMPAILAKSVEDKLFYTFNRLISLNEVGTNPFRAPNSLPGFHYFNSARNENIPLSMNALSTHDTKLSEDIRARINVLSEIPGEWEENLRSWHGTNSEFSTFVNGVSCPSGNEEYYIYQLLLGSYPLSGDEQGDYGGRLRGHLIKSIREAGIGTSWDKPDPAYENHYTDFVNALLDSSRNKRFTESFRNMYSVVSFHGFLNSITQKILQLTSPGIPDVYQGTEIWNFNLVDPDNRRKVNFGKILEMHRSVMDEFRLDRRVVGKYLNDYRDGRIKLLVSAVILNLRRDNPELFLKGSYTPVYADGKHGDNVVAFARSTGKMSLIVAVPRFTVSLGRMQLPVGKETWSGDYLKIPDSISGCFEDVFTGRVHRIPPGGMVEIGELFFDTPFSVLISRDQMPDK